MGVEQETGSNLPHRNTTDKKIITLFTEMASFKTIFQLRVMGARKDVSYQKTNMLISVNQNSYKY